jgi:hypothetical protein
MAVLRRLLACLQSVQVSVGCGIDEVAVEYAACFSVSFASSLGGDFLRTERIKLRKGEQEGRCLFLTRMCVATACRQGHAALDERLIALRH